MVEGVGVRVVEDAALEQTEMEGEEVESVG